MKKIALLLLLFVLPLELLADTVSLRRASALAETFMATDGTRAGGLTLAYSYDTNGNLMGGTRASGDPAIYVFNRPGGGFVLISGEDSFMPILGYSYTGAFRDDATMPDNLRAWIGEMTASINDLRAEHAQASGKIAGQWSQYESPTRAGSIKRATPVVQYTTAEWSQSEPYNYFCPEIGGQKAVTGCVATSIGILMYYYKFPNRSKLNFPVSSGEGYVIPSREANYDYQWNKMKMTYTSGSYTQEEAEACARLLADIGQIGNLSYGVNSTGGATKEVLGLMADYFGYDKGMCNVSRYYYTDDEWIAKLKAELNLRPMSYTGRSSTGGHAFVADGYDVNDYIHINWGWNGSSNGYYTINALGKYTNSHAATFGFHPDAGGTYIPVYSFYYGSTSAGVAYKGLEMVSAAITPNKAFTIKVGGVLNHGYSTHTAEIGIAHCRKDGTIKRMVNLTSMDVSSLDPGYWRGFERVNCKITDPIEEGDVLRAFFRADGNSWQKLYCESNAGITEAIRIEDVMSVEAASSLVYDKASQTLTINTKTSVQITVSAASGASTANFVTISTNKVVINLAQAPSDTYTVSMVTSAESKVFKIVR